jgi:hypothetical protein
MNTHRVIVNGGHIGRTFRKAGGRGRLGMVELRFQASFVPPYLQDKDVSRKQSAFSQSE